MIGVLMTLAATVGVGIFVSSTRLSPRLKQLVYLALALRVLGAMARYVVLFRFYGGSGDARGYYGRGLEYAEYFTRLDFSPLWDPDLWLRGQWWGTSFVSFPSGIILSIIGPSLLGEFIAFSLLSFLGLVGFAVAFKNANPHVPVANYARWIWLFPSLWFWPASVGKDALILMGMGLATWGLFGSHGRRSWSLILVGAFFVTAIRPQVTAVFLLSVVIAHWLASEERWTVQRLIRRGTMVVLGMVGIVFAMGLLGVDAFDPGGLQDYLEEESSAAVTRGTAADRVDFSPLGIPMAFVNIVARPFPWEATNPFALASALEIVFFWILVWYRRRNVWAALRGWRAHPLLRLALPFSLLYAVSLGMVTYNFGIIARQRIFLFPFLFVLLESSPGGSGRSSRPAPRPPPPRLILGPPMRSRR